MSALAHIFGQDAAIDWLSRAYQADRLPHGLIFSGPPGVGKGTTARALGKLFLCERPKGVSACNTCDSCRVFDAGNHPDFHLIYRQLARLEKQHLKARDLTADVVRDFLVAPANQKSALNIGKVFVVEEAELMNATAQNTLLKTLEEPAGRTLILLLTENADALLPTIRSRCQTVRFAALDVEQSAGELVKRGIDPALAKRAADIAGGSLGLAMKWIEDGVIDRAVELSGLVENLFAGRPPDDLPAWLKSASDAYAKAQVERDKLGSEDQARREGISLYLRLIAETARRRMLRLSQTNPVDAAALEYACDVIDAVQRSEQFLDANVNVSLVFQQLAATIEV